MQKNRGKNDWFKLAAAIALCESAGIVGALATASSVPTWYTALPKPTFAPPNWMFGPVWSLLYALMGISLYLVWNRGLEKPGVKKTLAIFGIQLVLNLLWPILFFGLHNAGLALIDIGLLVFAILATILQTNKVSKTAAMLLLPYLIWVLFATALNGAIWQLNS